MRAVAVGLLCLGVLGWSASFAQAYRVEWSVVGSGGDGMSGASYKCGATVGQAAAGQLTGSQYRAFIGYWQAEVEVGIADEQDPVLPEGPVTRLEAISPNPCPDRAQLRYSLATPGPVSITIHDLAGRQVRSLAGAVQPAGTYSVGWRGDDEAGRELPNGVYFCRFAAGDVRETGKLVLAR